MTENGLDRHASEQASDWVLRFASRLGTGSDVLDLACGHGRHARLLAARGCRVEAVDRDAAALAGLQGLPGITVRCADLEAGLWPYAGRCFDAVVVTNYLHRPLFPHLLQALAPGGMLIYETFMQGNEALGRPSNPDFLLRPDELLAVVRPALYVVAFEQGRVDVPKPAMIQRICAVNAHLTDTAQSLLAEPTTAS